jgi:tetratricopeptide (TPR) repeat protein
LNWFQLLIVPLPRIYFKSAGILPAGTGSICHVQNAISRTMAIESGPTSSPPFLRLFARLSWLGIFLLLMMAGQGCGKSRANRAIVRGVDAFKGQNYDLAIADFSEAIRLTPDYAEAYFNRGLAYDSKGDHDKAIADYSEAIRLKPDFGYAYDGRSIAFYQKGDYDKAIADENQAIRLDPSQPGAYYNRGIAFFRKDNYDKAIADYSETIRLKPDVLEAYIYRGLSYSKKGDYGKAIADYNEAIRLGPTDAGDYNNLAWLFATSPDADVRDGKKAVEYATKACELSEWKIPVYFDTLASAYAEVGDFDNAVKWENKCLESNPSKDNLEQARQRLSLYQQKKPYHEERPTPPAP